MKTINILITFIVLALNAAGQDFHLPKNVNSFDILDFCMDTYNNDCISTSNGIYLRQSEEWKFLTTDKLFRPDNRLYKCDIRFDSKGKLWVANLNGIGYYHQGEWQILNIPKRIKKDAISTMNVDKEGKYWIGASQGVWGKRDMIGWKLYKKLDNPFSSVNDIAIAPNGYIWVAIAAYTGSDGFERTEGGVSYFNGQWNSVNISMERLLKDNDGDNVAIWTGYKFIEDIAVDNNGEIWILNGNGQLMKYSKNKIKIICDKTNLCHHFAIDNKNIIHCIGDNYFTLDFESKK